MAPLSRPNTTSMTVEEAVDAAWKGKVRIPKFQRQLRWTTQDVINLLDSIAKGYPIGNLLLWDRPAPAQQVILGELIIDAPAEDHALWVVDGQQRLTSLANALNPETGAHGRFAVSFDLEKVNFVATPSYPSRSLIPLSTLFDLRLVLAWFASNPDMIEHVEVANAMTQQLRQFNIPVYIVGSDNPAILRDIFDRMNNFGRQLTRAEVFAALHASDEDTSSRPSFTEIAEEIDNSLNFGIIEDKTILSSILATRGPEIRREIRDEFKDETGEEVDQAYKAGQAALQRAVAFLQEAGVPHVTFLPYAYPLVVLARFFGLFPNPSERTLALLRRWYWRAVAAGPENFKGGTPNAGRVLCGKIAKASTPDGGEGRSIANLLAAVPNVVREVDVSRFAPQEAATKLLLCAEWARGPIHPDSGEPFSPSELAEAIGRYSTARDAIQNLAVPGLNQAPGTRFLLPGWQGEVRELFSGSAIEDGGRAELLRSHFAEGLDASDLTGFVRARSERLRTELNDYLSAMAEEGLIDTPSLKSLDFDSWYPDEEGGDESGADLR